MDQDIDTIMQEFRKRRFSCAKCLFIDMRSNQHSSYGRQIKWESYPSMREHIGPPFRPPFRPPFPYPGGSLIDHPKAPLQGGLSRMARPESHSGFAA
jgi:hypothetical protein